MLTSGPLPRLDRRPGLSGAAGFTLVEILVVLMILGILLAMGVGSFTEWMRNTRIRNQAESILNGLQYARAEAVKRNRFVRFQFVRRNEAAADELSRWAGCNLSNQSNHWIVSHGDPSDATTDTDAWPATPPAVYPADAKDNCARDVTTLPANYLLNVPAVPTSDPSDNPVILAKGVMVGSEVQDAAGQTDLRTQIVMGANFAAFPPALVNEAAVPATANVICFDGMGRLAWIDSNVAPGNCVTTKRPGVDFPMVATIDVMWKKAADNSDTLPCAPAAGGLRCMRVIVPASGEAKLCDPTVVDVRDPRICR